MKPLLTCALSYHEPLVDLVRLLGRYMDDTLTSVPD
jgi:hypothetical protein